MPIPLDVLIVEDNDLNRELLLRQLSLLGYQAEAVPSGQYGVDRFTASHYAIVLLDIMMPGLDGYATARLMRRLEQDESRTRTPIVAVTANAYPENRDACYAAGMDDWLTKPYTLEELQDKLERWVGTLQPSD
ncbi:MAG: response regulator [Acidobacteriota bacterium]